MTARNIRESSRVERFIDRIIAGDEQTQAWLRVTPRAKKTSPEYQRQSASRFANQPHVMSRLKERLRELPGDALISGPEWRRKVLDEWQYARSKDNMTAVAAFSRQIGQALGELKDTQVTVNSWKTADVELMRAMAGDDPAKQAAARLLLGEDSFGSEQPLPQTGQVNGSDTGTKH